MPFDDNWMKPSAPSAHHFPFAVALQHAQTGKLVIWTPSQIGIASVEPIQSLFCPCTVLVRPPLHYVDPHGRASTCTAGFTPDSWLLNVGKDRNWSGADTHRLHI